MKISTTLPRATGVSLTADAVVAELHDGRTISVPIAWFPRLLHATPVERANLRLIGQGEGVHWPDLDEDVSVVAMLTGRPSAESAASLKRWLAGRGG